MPGLMTARIAAHLVPDQQRSALRLTHQPSSAAQGQHLAVLVNDGAQQRAVAGMPLRRAGLNRPDTFYGHTALALSVPAGTFPSATALLRRSASQLLGRHLHHYQGAVRTGPILRSRLKKPRATSNNASALP